MGRMVDGEWTTQWYQPDGDGRFVRPETTFRDRVSAEPGARFAPEAGRYHLYVSYACPWAHRTLIGRGLMGLQDAIGVTVVDPLMGEDGWLFSDDDPDPHVGAWALRQVYAAADARFTGRVTVPVLWDTQHETIVSNESREILRMLSTGFRGLAARPVDLAPDDLRADIDAMITANYEPINNGVYKCGFATTQGAYEDAFDALFAGLDRCEAILGRQRWLCGDRLTDADICLFTTLARFDLVYFGHFKCNRTHIYELPNLWRFCLDLLAQPGVAETCDWDHMKRHYYWSHTSINPTRIVPKGPARSLANPSGSR